MTIMARRASKRKTQSKQHRDPSSIYSDSDLDTNFFLSYAIDKSDKDGHCLPVSVAKSINSQKPSPSQPPLTPQNVQTEVLRELSKNWSEYSAFLPGLSYKKTRADLIGYYSSGDYNIAVVDILPLIIARAFRICLGIVDEISSGQYKLCYVGDSLHPRIFVHKLRDHYNGLFLQCSDTASDSEGEDGVSSPGDGPSLLEAEDNTILIDDSSQHVDDMHTLLEAQLVSAHIEISAREDSLNCLRNAMDLLENEHKLSDAKHKKEIKRLQNDNERLRRELAAHRKSESRSLQQNAAASSDSSLDELQKCKQELASVYAILNEYVDVTNTLSSHFEQSSPHTVSPPNIATPQNISDDNDDGSTASFSRILSRKEKRRIARQNSQQNAGIQSEGSAEPSSGFSIPVSIGHGRTTRPVHDPPSYANVASSSSFQNRSVPNQESVTDETYLVGSSLNKKTGRNVNKLGVKCTSFTYSGREIPYISSRLPHILPGKGKPKPKNVAFQCAGNDLDNGSSVSDVFDKYASMINDAMLLCPSSDIYVCKVPPRRNNTKLLENIAKLNSKLEDFCSRQTRVHYIRTCPNDPKLYNDDLVHYNAKGRWFFAKRFSESLSGFTLLKSQRRA